MGTPGHIRNLVPSRTKKRSDKLKAHIGDIKAALIARGWEEDRYGHLHKKFAHDGGERHYRYKFGRGSLRREIKAGVQWVRLRSASYGKIFITDEGKLGGLRL